MQPISGLHVASLLDQRRFEVRLHHEDWHGPFDIGAEARAVRADLVFLTGLQVDFDRMGNGEFLRSNGALVVAGGGAFAYYFQNSRHGYLTLCAGGCSKARPT